MYAYIVLLFQYSLCTMFICLSRCLSVNVSELLACVCCTHCVSRTAGGMVLNVSLIYGATVQHLCLGFVIIELVSL